MQLQNVRNLAAMKYETVVKTCLFFGYNLNIVMLHYIFNLT